jgi:hypothetical protein
MRNITRVAASVAVTAGLGVVGLGVAAAAGAQPMDHFYEVHTQSLFPGGGDGDGGGDGGGDHGWQNGGDHGWQNGGDHGWQNGGDHGWQNGGDHGW